MSYSVVYKDIGHKDYKTVWDWQTELFNNLIDSKKEMPEAGVQAAEAHPGTIIIVEHPHVYTLGKSGSEKNLLVDYIQLQARDAEFFRIDRGGDITYHGPGQIVGYPIFDLGKIHIGLKEYVHRLEEVIIRTIGEYGITGERFHGGTGVWIDPDIPGKARKICAIGVRASKYVTMHGFALNVNTDLAYFNYINPCGFTDKGVTSICKEVGREIDPGQVKEIIKVQFRDVFDLEWINRQE